MHHVQKVHFCVGSAVGILVPGSSVQQLVASICCAAYCTNGTPFCNWRYMDLNGDNNIYTQIGFVVLVGLAAKNAILIVDFARTQEN